MLELKLYSGTDEFYMDLYKDDPVNLKFQYSDIEKIQASVGSFSQSFRIPASQANVDFFGAFFDANLQGGFNAKRKTQAELSVDTIPILSGYIQLKQVYLHKENYADFQIVFFGHSLDFAKEVGDAKLEDLDLSSYNHSLTYANYELALAGTLNSGEVRYALMDKGENWSNVGGSAAPINTDNPVQLSAFVPCILVRTLVEKIFDVAGFVLDSTFFASSLFDDIYTPMFNGSRYPIPTIPLDEYKFNVGLTATESHTFSEAGSNYLPTNFADSGGAFYDPLALYNTTTNIFSPTVSGDYSMSLRCFLEDVTVGPTFNSINFLLYLYNATDSVTVGAPFGYGDMAPGGTVEINEGAQTRTMNSTKSYALVIQVLQGDTVDVDIKTSAGGTGWTLHSITYPNSEQTVDMAANAPDIKQIEYIKGLQSMFNLVFITDKLNPLKITVEPWADYHTGGTIKDWSDYVDYSKDVVLSPTTDLQARDYEWRYTKANDFINKIYEDGGKSYGSYLIEDGENDFATSDKTVQPPFQACPTAEIPNTRMFVFKANDDKGKMVTKPKCMVVFYSEYATYDATTNPENFGGLFINDVGTTESQDDFPYIGHFSVKSPDVNDSDLNFGPVVPTYEIESSPYDNLYTTYWEQYVNQLYSTEARIMECHLYLTAAQINDFEFSDQIWIKNAYWRILSLGYSPNSDTTVKAKLIKILADVRPCQWIPYSSNVDGSMTFIDASGATGDPTEACCVKYGYSYVDGTCYQVQPDPVDNPIGVDPPPVFPGFNITPTEGNISAEIGQFVYAYNNRANQTITLPDATLYPNQSVEVKRMAGTYTVTVATVSSQTIDGATTDSIATNYDFRKYTSDGVNWVITGDK